MKTDFQIDDKTNKEYFNIFFMQKLFWIKEHLTSMISDNIYIN